MLLATLKNLLLESKELDKVWNYFFDLMDQGGLLKSSQAIPDPTKREVLVKVLGAIQPIFKQAKIVPLAFSEISSEKFYHGSIVISGILSPCVVFYFSDIEIGALIYSKNGKNEMFRLSLITITDPKMLTIH